MCEYYTLDSSSTDERRRRQCPGQSADDTVLIHNHIDRLTHRPIDHIDRTASLRWQRLVQATAIIVGQARQRSAGTTSPEPRLRNGWGSSALVITDSRVSFSDARICCDGIAVRDPSIVLNVGPILDALAAFAGG